MAPLIDDPVGVREFATYDAVVDACQKATAAVLACGDVRVGTEWGKFDQAVEEEFTCLALFFKEYLSTTQDLSGFTEFQALYLRQIELTLYHLAYLSQRFKNGYYGHVLFLHMRAAALLMRGYFIVYVTPKATERS